MMTQEQMNVLVPHKLHEIEQEYGVKILHAVETGSRAWGFASPDSDFDVRFIYIRLRNDYLRLNPHRDVIEMPVDDTWDVSGWDLHKALRLLWKSNPTVFEWWRRVCLISNRILPNGSLRCCPSISIPRACCIIITTWRKTISAFTYRGRVCASRNISMRCDPYWLAIGYSIVSCRHPFCFQSLWRRVCRKP